MRPQSLPIVCDGPFTFSPEFTTLVVGNLNPTGPDADLLVERLAFPASMVMYQRVLIGLYALLGSMHATVSWGPIYEELVTGGPIATSLGHQEAEFFADRTPPA